MSEKNIEMMKKLIEKKREQQDEKQKFSQNKKIGRSQREKNNLKTGGSNNKV